jgi:hypothetical protein
MKYIFLILAATFALSNGYGSEEPRFEASNKIYIQPNQITFSENGIFVYLENAWHGAKAIHVDSTGMYVNDLVDRSIWDWICRYCATSNPYWRTTCEGCGRGRGG